MKQSDHDVGAALAMALQQTSSAAANGKRPWHIAMLLACHMARCRSVSTDMSTQVD